MMYQGSLPFLLASLALLSARSKFFVERTALMPLPLLVPGVPRGGFTAGALSLSRAARPEEVVVEEERRVSTSITATSVISTSRRDAKEPDDELPAPDSTMLQSYCGLQRRASDAFIVVAHFVIPFKKSVATQALKG